jgi:hypothetical protein
MFFFLVSNIKSKCQHILYIVITINNKIILNAIRDELIEIRSGRNQKEVLNPNGKYPVLGSAGKIMGYADKYICKDGNDSFLFG